MLPLEVGKLYSCSKYFLLLYPDKDTAAALAAHAAALAAADAYWTRELARKLGKPVSYCNPLTPLLVLSTVNKYVEVLAGDCKGWITNEDWLDIKELANEAA